MTSTPSGTTPAIPNTNSAIEFLEEWQENGGFVQLTAINPQGGAPVTKCFVLPTDNETAAGWIDVRQGNQNLYFAVNPLKALQDKKASKDDVSHLAWLHVDIDPSGNADTFEGERSDILTQLETFRPRPTVVLDSGGGYQAFYKLDKPIEVRDQADIVELEGWNKRLELALDGDNCHNIDRIMRLPGTINVPGETKLAKGRKPALAQVVWSEDETHTLPRFAHLPLPQAAAVTAAPVVYGVKTTKNFQDYIAKYPGSQLAKLRTRGPGDDRSKFDYAMVAQLKEQGFDNGDIAAVLFDYPNSKAAERTQPQAYISQLIAKVDAKIAMAEVKSLLGLTGPKLHIWTSLGTFSEQVGTLNFANTLSHFQL